MTKLVIFVIIYLIITLYGHQLHKPRPSKSYGYNNRRSVKDASVKWTFNMIKVHIKEDLHSSGHEKTSKTNATPILLKHVQARLEFHQNFNKSHSNYKFTSYNATYANNSLQNITSVDDFSEKPLLSKHLIPHYPAKNNFADVKQSELISLYLTNDVNNPSKYNYTAGVDKKKEPELENPNDNKFDNKFLDKNDVPKNKLKYDFKETKYVDGEGNEEEDKKLSLFDKINNELLLGENNSINLQENPVTTGSDVTINPIDYPSESELTADVEKKEELEEYEEFEGLFYNETMLYPFIEDPFNRSDAQLKDVITSFVTKEENMENSNRDLSSSHILPILSSHNYNNNTIPVLFNDLPVFVMVSLDIIDISSFNMQTMDYVIDVLLNLKWMDFRFARKNKKTIRIGEKTILERIWSPDIYFVNAKRSYFHKITFPNHRMRIESDGTVTYTLRLTLQPSCNMNFEKFPHDHQRCDLQLSSIAYSERQIKLLWFQESFKIINPPTLPEFKLMSVTANECLTQERLIPSSCLRLGFSLKRDSAKYFVEKYIPSTLAMMFAWVAPYVPYNYEDVRIVTPITILLALVQMQKGDEETRISYLTSLDKWFSMMKMFSLISLVESLVVLSLVRKSRALKKKQSKALNDFEREMLIIQERQVKKLYDRIDAMALILSPIIFALYVSYYLTYMVNDSEDYPV